MSGGIGSVVHSWYKNVAWTPEQVAVLPRRVREYGHWPKAHPLDGRWIKDGELNDGKELFPWLHEYQQGGYEVCILGSSLEACKVCAEAYESGFQPALIFLEDKVPEENKELTMKAVELLKSRRFRTGILNCGFDVVTAQSNEVKIQLQPDGQVSDVRLEAKAQRYDVMGKPIDYAFKGPAIVVGCVIDASMVDGELDVDSLVLYHERNITETEHVISPEFWERRNDPECRTFATPTFGTVIPVLCFTALQSSLCFTMTRFHTNAQFVFIRAVADVFHRLALCNAVVIIDYNFYGHDVPTCRVTSYTLVPIAIYQLASMAVCLLKWDERFYVADFANSLFGVSSIQYVLHASIILFSNVKFGLWSLLMGYAGVIGTAGSWFQCMPIMLLYQLLLGWNGALASVFLSVVLTMCEMGMVKFLGITYTVVAKKRREDPNRLAGDQKMGLSFCVACTHCFFETARLASLVCGAVGAKDAAFLGNVAVSLITSTVINSAFRTGFMANQLVKIPKIGRKFCPTGLWCLHNNVKFSMGWCRYFNMLGLFLCRGFIHGKWKVEQWTIDKAGDQGVWCWSGVVLTTVLLAFLAEVLEDAIVYCVCRNSVPVMRTQVYRDIMVERLENPRTASRLNVAHYLMPPAVTSRVSGRHSLQSNADEFVLTPNLVGVRPLPVVYLCAVGTANNILLLGAISLGVGSGNTFGFCRSLNFEDDAFIKFLRNFAVWSFDCQDLQRP